MLRHGWIAPVRIVAKRQWFDERALHAALRRLERGEYLPADKTRSARVMRSYVRHPQQPKPTLEQQLADFVLELRGRPKIFGPKTARVFARPDKFYE
jgi:hypothetical protein